jgi:hypothetical protein
MHALTKTLVVAAAVSLGSVALATPGDHGHGHAKGRPLRGKSELAVPEAAADADAHGVVALRYFPAVGKRAERSWFRVRLGALDGVNTEYTLWVDDPATVDVVDLVQVATLTADEDGAARLKLDSKRGDTMPFGATIAGLAGLAVEVHDAAGAVVLTGALPAVQ